jgi:hypothetical protein
MSNADVTIRMFDGAEAVLVRMDRRRAVQMSDIVEQMVALDDLRAARKRAEEAEKEATEQLRARFVNELNMQIELMRSARIDPRDAWERAMAGYV